MGCRNMKKCDAAAALISESYPSAEVVPMKIDLGSIQSVEDFAKNVQLKFNRLDIVGKNN